MSRISENIKAIIVDDEDRGATLLQEMLRKNCPQVQVMALCSSADEAKEKIFELRPQLVFLDISMPTKNAFEMLNEIGDTFFEIIFTTAHSEYALNAFHYSAVDYLIKPIDEELLVEAVRRAEKRTAMQQSREVISTLIHNLSNRPPGEMRICISSLKGFQVVEVKDILYFEASGTYSNLWFTNNQMICVARPIYEYEELLADAFFVRVHKSHLVNLLHVREYLRGEGGSLRLTNGKELEVSRRKKDFFLQKMKEYSRY